MIDFRKLFRGSLAIVIILFLIFQIIIIQSNVKYGAISEIRSQNSDILVSPNQFHFNHYSNTTHTLANLEYYVIGQSNSANSSTHLDLIKTSFTEGYGQIVKTELFGDLEVLKTTLTYGGLSYHDNSLWTIGSLTTIVDNSTIRFESVIIQFDETGQQLRRTPIPIETYTDLASISSSMFKRIIVQVTSTEVVYLQITPNGSEVVLFNLIQPGFTKVSLSISHHSPISFANGHLLWMRYEGDPYQFEEGSINDQKDNTIQYNALSLNNLDDNFVQTIRLDNLRSSKAQISLSTVETDLIAQPVFHPRDDQYLYVSQDMVILPVYIEEFTDNSTTAFYGMDIYVPTSAFFSITNIVLLSGIMIFSIITIYSKFKISKDPSRISSSSLN